MRHLALLVSWEQGHLRPTIALGRELVSQGCRVTVVGIPDVGPLVRSHGLEFRPIFANTWPLGSMDIRRGPSPLQQLLQAFDHLEQLASCNAPIRALDSIQADGLLVWWVASLEAVCLVGRVGAPLGVITTELRQQDAGIEQLARRRLGAAMRSPAGLRFIRLLESLHGGSLERVIRQLAALPEAITCPEILLHDEEALPASYLGPCVLEPPGERRRSSGSAAEQGSLRVYLAFGSQAVMFPEAAQRWIRLCMAAFQLAKRRDLSWRLEAAFPRRLANGIEVPANVTVHDWLPQRECLSDADLFITHGGANSVKEAIVAQVPMIVMPLGRDQPENGRRIDGHGLGRVVSSAASTEQLLSMFEELPNDVRVRERLAEFASRFAKARFEGRERAFASRVVGAE